MNAASFDPCEEFDLLDKLGTPLIDSMRDDFQDDDGDQSRRKPRPRMAEEKLIDREAFDPAGSLDGGAKPSWELLA